VYNFNYILDNINKLNGKLSAPVFSKKDILLSYRMLNHYDEMGLLIGKRDNIKQWRKFNGFDYIWINIIIILREIGVPLKKIKYLKTKLFEEGRSGNIDKANFINQSFQEEVLSSIIDKYELYLLVFYDNSYTFHDSTSLNQCHNGVYKNEPHINIPLSNIISEVIDKHKEI